MSDGTDKLSAADIEEGVTGNYWIVELFRQLPYEFDLPIPFTRVSLHFGGQNLEVSRRRVRQRPDDWREHNALAALLLSQIPLTKELAEEAASHLRSALELLPSDVSAETVDGQDHAMVHQVLGDALLKLGDVRGARKEWELAIELDPIPPPYGFAGNAAERLKEHPEPDSR